MFQKISVEGEDRHPLNSAPIEAKPKAEGADAMREKLSHYGVPDGRRERRAVERREVGGRAGRPGSRPLLPLDIAPEDPRLLAMVDAAPWRIDRLGGPR